MIESGKFKKNRPVYVTAVVYVVVLFPLTFFFEPPTAAPNNTNRPTTVVCYERANFCLCQMLCEVSPALQQPFTTSPLQCTDSLHIVHFVPGHHFNSAYHVNSH